MSLKNAREKETEKGRSGTEKEGKGAERIRETEYLNKQQKEQGAFRNNGDGPKLRKTKV